MAYTIYKADGTAVTVPDNAIDSTYYYGTPYSTGQGIYLVGRNAIQYGVPTAQNFLQITENFCSATMPNDTTALQGQLWFSKTSSSDGVLYVRNSGATSGGMANWSRIVTSDSSGNSTVTGNLTVDGNATVGGILSVGVNAAVAAAGSTQAGATLLADSINVVNSGTGGVRLPSATAGMRVIVRNTTGSTINVYPFLGGNINGGSANVAVTLPTGTAVEYIASSSTAWFTMNATYAA